jgi:FtsH-binding integral membrane protein
VDRYVKLTYEYAITNPFTPRSLISLVAPLVTASHSGLFHTDVSMNNHYFGVILLPFMIYGLFRKNSMISLCMLSAGILLLFLSFGEHFFLHRLFYEYVPFFDKFRHPSSFRFITILLFLLYTGIQISRHDPSDKQNLRFFRKVYLAFISVILLLCLVTAGMIVKRVLGTVDFTRDWNSLINDYGIYGPLFLQTGMILLINSFFILFIIIKRKTDWFYPAIILMLITEAVIFTQLNMKYTVTSTYNPLEIRAFLLNRPSGFPLPDHHLIAENTEESVAFVPLINNTNTYAKTVSPGYMYPFYLDEFKRLENDPLVFSEVINNKLLYFSDSADPGDSIACTYFSPNRMVFSTQSDTSKTAILLQNNYPGWNVTVDGTKALHYTVKHSLIGVELPAGHHVIVYEFSNPLYKNATLLSFALFGAMLVIVLITKKSKSKGDNIATAGYLVILIYFVVKPAVPFENTHERYNWIISRYLKAYQDKDVFMLFNTDSPHPFDSVISGKALYRRFRYQTEVKSLVDLLDSVKSDTLVYIWSNVLEPEGLQGVMQLKFPLVKKKLSLGRFGVTELIRKSGYTPRDQYVNDYEKPSANWSSEGVITDSIHFNSGRSSEQLSPSREFSSTFRYVINRVPNRGLKVFTALKFMNEKGQQPFHLVIAVNRKVKTVHYHAVDLKRFSDNSGWNTGFAEQQWLRSSLRKGDEIIVYCWNSGKNEAVYLDDFIVQFESGDANFD